MRECLEHREDTKSTFWVNDTKKGNLLNSTLMLNYTSWSFGNLSQLIYKKLERKIPEKKIVSSKKDLVVKRSCYFIF